MQIAFYTEARRVGISPQQPSLGQIVPCSAVPCCCCAEHSRRVGISPQQPSRLTATAAVYTYAAIARLPFTLRRVELASAHSNQAWDRLYLLCHAAAVQNSPTAGLNCCVYTYADCLLH